MKDKEWLKDEVARIYDTRDYWSVDDLRDEILDSINELDEPEKVVVPEASSQELPVIPKFVANFIKETKKQNRSMVFAITHIYDKNEIGESPNREENRLFQWMELDDNEEVFARAWLDGFTVEEEQKYYVLDTEDIPMLVITHGVVNRANTHLSIHEKGRNTEHYQLTEQEIKDYDERFWAFAVPVEEVQND